MYDIDTLYTFYPECDYYDAIKYTIMNHFAITLKDIHIGFYNK